MKLTYLQKKWLSSRGDRDETDVFEDELGLYVEMGDGKSGLKRVYVPSDYKLKEEYEKTM